MLKKSTKSSVAGYFNGGPMPLDWDALGIKMQEAGQKMAAVGAAVEGAGGAAGRGGEQALPASPAQIFAPAARAAERAYLGPELYGIKKEAQAKEAGATDGEMGDILTDTAQQVEDAFRRTAQNIKLDFGDMSGSVEGIFKGAWQQY